jgi:Threonine dehydrogenase and related Zn-dependent dehydrogenases
LSHAAKRSEHAVDDEQAGRDEQEGEVKRLGNTAKHSGKGDRDQQKDVPARLKQEGVGNVDVVIECVGKPVTIEQAIQIAGHKATVMMFGLTKPDETITVKPFEVFQKELVLTSSYINPYTQRRALELIDSGRLDVSSMVAKVASLDELGAILSDPALRAMGKYIIDPSK